MDRRKTYTLYGVLRIQMYTQAKIFFLAAWAQANRHAFNRKAEPLGGTPCYRRTARLASSLYDSIQAKNCVASSRRF